MTLEQEAHYFALHDEYIFGTDAQRESSIRVDPRYIYQLRKQAYLEGAKRTFKPLEKKENEK